MFKKYQKIPPKLIIGIVLQFMFLNLRGQISVTFPTNRIVFQRDNQNVGFINIIGYYTQDIDKVEAKLTPIVIGQGTETQWVLLQENPKAGYFAGKIQGLGGWYKLEVRAIKGNSILKTILIDRVGIGEVFIALGQSNAQGIPNYGAKGAADDRVNTIDFQNSQVLDPLPENLNFVQLGESVNIAPQGDGPWCYGELGDRLAKRLNVPVAFFNEGLLLVSVINWRESAEGLPTYNFVLDIGGRFQLPKGLPYINLKNTLRYYGSLMGVRSLLWIQGETDNSPNYLKADEYAKNLQRVIDISRNDFDNNLTWVVSRTSLTYLAPSNNEIISGQNKIIDNSKNNVFAGPFTDDLQVPRIDGVHFKNVPDNMGISVLAESWDKALNDIFFKNSTPILAKSILEPEISCDKNGAVVLTIPSNFKVDDWRNDGKNTSTVLVGKGEYSYKVNDEKGNFRLFPKINTTFLVPRVTPTITSKQDLNFCEGSVPNIELIADGNGFNSFLWNTGESTKQIIAQKEGVYSVIGKDASGCPSDTSQKIIIKGLPIPPQPTLTNLGTDTLVIQNGSFILYDQFEWIKDNNLKYYTDKPFFKVPYNGNYTVSVIRNYPLDNNKTIRCTSLISKSISVTNSPNSFLLNNELNDLETLPELLFMPNPTNGKIRILSNQWDIQQIKIYSLQGNKVFEQKVEMGTDLILNVGHLPSGSYILEFNGREFKHTKRLVIN